MGHDILISALPAAVALQLEPTIVQASIEAGVRRFMPSEYTLDVTQSTACLRFKYSATPVYELALNDPHECLVIVGECANPIKVYLNRAIISKIIPPVATFQIADRKIGNPAL